MQPISKSNILTAFEALSMILKDLQSVADLDLRVHGFGGRLGFFLGIDNRRLIVYRHEFSVESGDNIDDPVGHLWSQFGPWLEIPGSQFS